MKFLPDNENILFSGGWDDYIMLWDLRNKQPIGMINGPTLSGDSLDIKNDMILTGSY